MAKKQKNIPSKKIKKWKEAVRKTKKAKSSALEVDDAINKAINLFQQNRKEEAQQILQKLLKKKNNDPIYLNKLGYLAHCLGHSALALDLLKQSTELRPSAPFYNNLGLVHEQIGQLEDAQKSYLAALKLDPEFATAHYNLGNIYQHKSKLAKSIEHYLRAVEIQPDYVVAYNNLANAQMKIRAYSEARKSCTRALRIDSGNFEAIKTWCTIVIHQEKPAEILKLLDRELGFMSKKSPVFAELANIFSSLGMKEEAYNFYRNALKDDDRPGTIYYRMAMISKLQKADPKIKEIEKAYASFTDTENRRFLCFAMGKVYEDIGEYPQAFKYIAEGNRLLRDTYSYSIDEDQHFFTALKSIFTSQFFDRLKVSGAIDSTPIFIVGMPRSGTTLIEQILASHSQVYAAGELHDLQKITRNTVLHESGKQIPDGLDELTPDSLNKIGNEYISTIRGLGRNAKRITDKMPHNFLWIGIIHLALPHAKIIHCKRDSMDVCWSIYKNIFQVPHKYAQDLVELGKHYRLYVDLMEYWKQIVGDDIFEIEYEKLIQDQEYETRRLLDFCNLPWEEDCLEFYKTERTVHTTSLEQVRNPIYSSSVKKWKHFEKELQPLTEILFTDE